MKTLSEVAGDKVHETFVGSCMTNIGHFRAAGKLLEKYGEANTRLWIVPPTRMDEHQLKQEGYYKIFENSKARVEIPGCSLYGQSSKSSRWNNYGINLYKELPK